MIWQAKDLKQWRLDQKWTQLEAAEHLGMSREGYLRLEKGRHPVDRRTMLACMELGFRNLSPEQQAKGSLDYWRRRSGIDADGKSFIEDY